MFTGLGSVRGERCYASRLKHIMIALLLAFVTMAAPAAETTSRPQTYYLLVFNSPLTGQEAEYNSWYDQEHLPDVVSMAGFVSAQRFIYNDVQLREVALKRPKYLALYEIRTNDLSGVVVEVKRRLTTGQTRISPSLDQASGQMYIYRAFRPRVAGAGGQPIGAAPGKMEIYYQIVFGDAVAGQDDAFNAWYDHDHAPRVAAAAGFLFGQRAIISDVQLEPIADPSRYLALFEIQTTDLASVFGHIKFGTEPPPAFDRARTFGYTYRAIGPVLFGENVRAARQAGNAQLPLQVH